MNDRGWRSHPVYSGMPIIPPPADAKGNDGASFVPPSDFGMAAIGDQFIDLVSGQKITILSGSNIATTPSDQISMIALGVLTGDILLFGNNEGTVEIFLIHEVRDHSLVLSRCANESLHDWPYRIRRRRAESAYSKGSFAPPADYLKKAALAELIFSERDDAELTTDSKPG